MNGLRLSKNQYGIAITELLVAGGACLVVIFIGLAIGHKLHNTNNGSSNTPAATNSTTTNKDSSSTNQYTTLSPATVPSKVAECSQALTFTSGGNSGPVTCASGDLNTTEWNSLETLEPSVLALGYNATAAQVQKALCADVGANVSNPIEETAYQIATLYYGWRFTTNPSVVLTNGTCENVDD